ncbi:hypothetical protein [Cohnella rhizosphaerae]|uniref:Uncharacterized protein n=1 Tax=Cohnella rhizosphaerae TaxID=1457232 RepID=A0A9X4QTT3_9BACL|nr:hypothetical protein [Cohnella rhizosphaerae]MDG0809742.1 hypothetical protein [Cohnella rhizosphaerae]
METTQEQDFENYRELSERVPETVGVLRLEFKQFAEDFAAMNGYRVDVSGDEPQLLFSYPDPENPEDPPFYQAPLSVQVAALQAESVQTMLAVAEVYETATAADAAREEEAVNTMLGLAEAYDVIMQQQAVIDDLTARVAALEGGES